MSGNTDFLQKYMTRRTPELADGDSQESDADDLGAFGWLRGVKERSIMLELRKKTGRVVAIGYGWIEKIEFEPSEGIKIHAMGQVICIKGRNLNSDTGGAVSLFAGLCRHRVPWIQEADQSQSLQADSNATLVESIEFAG